MKTVLLYCETFVENVETYLAKYDLTVILSANKSIHKALESTYDAIVVDMDIPANTYAVAMEVMDYTGSVYVVNYGEMGFDGFMKYSLKRHWCSL